MSYEVIHADARDMPLADNSVDLCVTSPPYWSLRSYRDGGEHYDGQIGSEDNPQQFVDELVGVLDGEVRRVLKPSGSLWLNLGDKYAGSGGHNNSGISDKSTLAGHGHVGGRARDGSENKIKATRRSAPDRYKQTTDARPKSLLGLPWRVALALIDRGWILRAEVIWSKPNGLPESVTDRVRRSHEQFFHFTLEGQYYSAVDRIREELATADRPGDRGSYKPGHSSGIDGDERESKSWAGMVLNPLGRLPGSVRSIPTQPLIIPDQVKEQLGLVDHYAAFPMEWPRWIIEGWSPEKVCTACGEGYAPVTEKAAHGEALKRNRRHIPGYDDPKGEGQRDVRYSITGESCACNGTAPTTRGVVLDCFGGTGTVAGVAHTLGRHGVSVDLSMDYCRLAEWRISESGHFAKAEQASWAQRQETLL